MNCLLVAINAKYIHSNPGILYLKAYHDKYAKSDIRIDTAEYTINQQIGFIVADIYEKCPDILCFSCYIWNIREVLEVADTIKKVMPDVRIFAGGPEVSYRACRFLKEYTVFEGVMCGEGEKIFSNLMQTITLNEDISTIAGLCIRTSEGIAFNPQREVLDMNEIPFIYEDIKGFENRIIYYESSRGCPFSCSYCLSSIDKTLRFKDISKVKTELQFFIDNKVPQVKFIDRTFNCKRSHALEIWNYIYENDNGITNFHFEVAADLIDEEQLELFSKMRKGLIQLEIGVQSTNSDTIKEIDRTMDIKKLTEIIAKVKSFGNIHQHVDLIAGLPYEDLESFKNSFNQVYGMKCEQLQLGFLKVLSGSKMYNKAADYGLQYTSTPPYEVLETKWLSYSDVLELKKVEDMVEVYYNSGQFENTMQFLEKYYDTPYELYRSLGDFYSDRFKKEEKHSRISRYELILEYANKCGIKETKELCEWMMYDLYLRENLKKRPAFAINLEEHKEKLKELYHIYKPVGKNIHIEVFEKIFGEEVRYMIFDYDKKGEGVYAKTEIR